MTCSSPISWDDLAAYWAGDLAPEAVDRVEEHLIGCGTCSAESARAFAVVDALRVHIPPVVSRAALANLRARGMRIVENAFKPDERQEALFAPETDLLIHRLAGFDLLQVTRVQVTLRAESTGDVLFEDPDAPFDPREGVLIACQRHYSVMPHDTVFEIRAIEKSGAERTARYLIPHVFQG
jgi:hypothetical protein